MASLRLNVENKIYAMEYTLGNTKLKLSTNLLLFYNIKIGIATIKQIICVFFPKFHIYIYIDSL
jgi:hypothetical protein